MKKTFIPLLLFFIVTLFAAAAETNAQEPVSQSERRTVIKALETKIAELEVKRAMQLYNADNGIDIQLANLRKRLAELTGKRATTLKRRTASSAAVGQNGKASPPKKSLQLTDSPVNFRVLY